MMNPINAITSYFRSDQSDADRPTTIERLSDELRMLPADIEAARVAYAASCLDLAEGVPDAQERVQQTADKRERLDRRRETLLTALAAAQARAKTASDTSC